MYHTVRNILIKIQFISRFLALFNIEVKWVQIPLEPHNFCLAFICNCFKSYFTTANMSFTSILYPKLPHMIFIIYTSRHSTTSLQSSSTPLNSSIRMRAMQPNPKACKLDGAK